MTKEMTYGTILFATLMMFLIGFSVIIVLDSYTDKKRKRLFAVIITLVFVLIMQNYIEYWLMEYHRAIMWRTFVAIVGYSVRPAILVLYAHLIYPKMKHIIAWCLVGVNAVLHSTAFYSHLVFYIADYNGWQAGPLYLLCLIVSVVLLVYLIFLIILKYKKEKAQKKEIVFHFFWILIIVAGVVADIIWNKGNQCVGYQTVSVVGVSVLSYIWLHQQFVYEYETNFVAEQRIRVTLSQIKPHFIYNTLSAIADMKGVPEEAQNAIEEFSKYLRENLDTMTSSDLVTFEKELDHIKKYLDLEALRFGDKIKVFYEITDTDFLLPSLTVQMLVENAVKHGITKKYEGGTIRISTKKEGKKHIVIVEDDGVGFDTTTEISGNHYGISSIRKRLEYFLDGTLEIVSEVGKGTTATVVIPDGHKEITL